MDTDKTNRRRQVPADQPVRLAHRPTLSGGPESSGRVASRPAPSLNDVNLFESLLAGEATPQTDIDPPAGEAACKALYRSTDPFESTPACQRRPGLRAASPGGADTESEPSCGWRDDDVPPVTEDASMEPPSTPPPLPLALTATANGHCADTGQTPRQGQRQADSTTGRASESAAAGAGASGMLPGQSPRVSGRSGAGSAGSAGGAGNTGSSGLTGLHGVDASSFSLTLHSRDFGDLALTAERSGTGWRIRLASDDPDKRQALQTRRDAIARGLTRQLGASVDVEIDA